MFFLKTSPLRLIDCLAPTFASRMNSELTTWGPGFNQPCIDPFGLAIHTYLAFTKQQEDFSITILNTNTTLSHPSLKDGATIITGLTPILTHLANYRGLDLDSFLSPKERADCTAFKYLCTGTLYDALLQSWWLESGISQRLIPREFRE